VLQNSIELGGVPHKVIGVMPKDSTWPEEAELFKPLGFGRTPPQWSQRRDNHVFRAVARLKPGVDIEQAQAKLTTLGARVAETNANRAGTNWKLHRMKDFVIGTALTRTLWVLLGAVFVVLLIACVNVANLLLARAAARDREVVIRKALGAGRSRLATQFMIESAVLALCGGSAGVLLGYLGAKAMVLFAPEGVPRLPNAHLDFTVLAFTIALCLLTTIVFGLVPIMNNARRSTSEAIREGGRSSSDGVRTSRMRGLLVVSELALAVILLAGAGLLIRSFILLQRVDPGFPAKNLLALQISLPTSRYSGAPQVKAGFERIADAVRRVPGVVSAAAASSLPLGGGGFIWEEFFSPKGSLNRLHPEILLRCGASFSLTTFGLWDCA
jgi:putative ABC transport system permease protein